MSRIAIRMPIAATAKGVTFIQTQRSNLVGASVRESVPTPTMTLSATMMIARPKIHSDDRVLRKPVTINSTMTVMVSSTRDAMRVLIVTKMVSAHEMIAAMIGLTSTLGQVSDARTNKTMIAMGSSTRAVALRRRRLMGV